MKFKYYSLDNILSRKAHYNIIFGERSNGKTYACLRYGLSNYVKTGRKMAYVRRFKEDFIGKRGQALFESIVANNEVEKMTGGRWNTIYYYASKWYLAKYDEKLNKMIHEEEPFAYGFALSDMEHDKSTSYPKIDTIIFDEFISRQGYFPDEFVVFMNVISTVVRQRDNVKIFMLGNTVNKYCPYFAEMGLSHIDKMQKSNIDIYTYGTSTLRVAVEYADSIAKKKPSDVYFAFDNPKLNMIKNGEWEIGMYPHLPYKYKPSDIVFEFFIEFNQDIIHCEIINVENDLFCYCHRKTTPIKNRDTDLIFSMIPSPQPNIRTCIFEHAGNKTCYQIAKLFALHKVFYQTNEIGEIVRNYLLESQNMQNIS